MYLVEHPEWDEAICDGEEHTFELCRTAGNQTHVVHRHRSRRLVLHSWDPSRERMNFMPPSDQSIP